MLEGESCQLLSEEHSQYFLGTSARGMPSEQTVSLLNLHPKETTRQNESDVLEVPIS